MHSWRHERILWTAALALAFILVTPLLRNPTFAGGNLDSARAMKLSWLRQADCVLAGDSRTTYSLVPRAIEQHLTGVRTLNFGFNLVAFTPEYLDAIEAILDPNTACPIIVLGITPHSLTPHAVRLSAYADSSRDASLRSPTRLTVSRAMDYLRPMRLDTLPRDLNPLSTATPILTFHPDGWVAFAPARDSIAAEIHMYETAFAEGPVDPQLQQALLDRVSRWSEAGIRVYALRPPTSPAMLALEARLSGFDEEHFIRRFEAAGGLWIATPQTTYHCPDGSHLRFDAAWRFSTDVAQTMQASRFATAPGQHAPPDGAGG